jgi:CRP-like cAMP-binding protein
MSAQFFQHLTAIAPLKPATISELERCLHTEEHPRNHLLVREGEMSEKMYFLLKGAARAYFFQQEKEYTDWFVFEHMFMCSLSAFFGGVLSVQFIETLEPSHMLVLHRHDLNRICEAHHDMQTLNSRILAHSLVVLQQNIIDQRFLTAQERYRQLMHTYPKVLQRVPLKYIASFLGVTQETLSRIRASAII